MRLVSATNRDLDARVKEGEFREDLYYRVDVVRIDLPPLRQRRSDIPLLVRHFFGDDGLRITPEAMQYLELYNWPGNVRELQNVAHLPKKILNPGGDSEKKKQQQVGQAELEDVLKQLGWNQSEAARVLGIDRVTAWRKIQKFGIQIPEK